MSLAIQIFNKRFKAGAELRSAAYRHGVLDQLHHEAEGEESPVNRPRYQPGTAERDAWLSGLSAGHLLWLCHQDAQELRNYLAQPDIPGFLREQAR